MKKERTEEFEGISVPWYVRFIHTQLKNTFIAALVATVGLLPKKAKIDSYDKITSSELQLQWRAMEVGIKEFNRQHKYHLDIGGQGRSNEAIRLLATIYFTILERDANWQIISASVLNAYKELKYDRK